MGNPASARFNIRDVDTCATEPDMVSRPSASPGDETLEVSWSEPDDGGAEIKRYHVQHRDSSSSWPSDYTSVSDRTLDITGLTNGVLYYVRVQACNDVGCGDWSRSASGVPRTTPGRPAAPSLDTGDRRLFASWSSPDDGGSPLTHFNLRYRRKGASSWEPQVTISTSKGNQVTTYTIMGLAVGVEYEAQVRARNVAGNGPWSPSGAGFTNRPPEFDDEDNTRKVAENTQSGSPFDDPVAATDDDGDKLEYSLEGTDATSFDIDSATGQLKTEDALDYETDNSYSVTVQVKDGNGGSDSIDVTINVTDVNEAPEVESQIAGQTLTTGGSTRLDLPDHFDDPDGDALSYTASSSDTGVATVRVEAGALRLTAVSEGSATVTVEAADRSPEDSDRLTVSQSFEVTVEPPPNTAPTIKGPDRRDFAENGRGAVATYSASDPDGDDLDWTLSGDDDGHFSIDSGVLGFNNPPDFETKADSDGNNRYEVTVEVSDNNGGSDDIDVTINVTNVDELGVVSLSTTTPTVDAAISASLSDPDGGVSIISWQWQRSANGSTWSDISGATLSSYTLVVADHNQKLRASVSYNDKQGTGKSAISAGSSAAAYPPYPALTAPTLTLGGEGDTIVAAFTVPGQTDLFDYRVILEGRRDSTAPIEVDYRVVDDTSPTVSGRHTFDSLSSSAGDLFRARLTVCRKSDSTECGTAAVSAELRRPLPPTGLSLSDNPAESAHLEVSYTASEKPHRYKTELHRSMTEMGTYTALEGSLTSGESSRPTFLNQDREWWYKARTKNCIDAAYTQCGLWSAFSPAKFLKPKLDAPELDVEPRPLRKARLKWEPVTNADKYEVVFHESSSVRRIITVTVGTQLDISLDSIFSSGKGLADSPYQYDFQVKAAKSDGSYLDSEYSDTIKIKDNPLLTEGGMAASLQRNAASLEWAEIQNIKRYSIRFRKLGNRPIAPAVYVTHSHIDWPGYEEWPYDNDEDTVFELTLTPPSSGDVSTSVSLLDSDEIYAFQINYETTSGEQVFSARDAYVWLSDVKPEDKTRVATYPFFGHHVGRTFKYFICENGFPPDDPATRGVNERDEWVKLIRQAFMEWQDATNGFITMMPTTENCSTTGSGATPPAQFIQDDDDRNEVRMLDLKSGIYDLWEFKSDVFKICLTQGAACVTSFAGYSGLETNCDITADTCQVPYALGFLSIDRTRIAKLLEDQRSTKIPSLELLGVIEKATSSNLQASNELRGVDVTFKEGAFPEGPNIPSSSSSPPVPDPGQVRFNTCLDSGAPDRNDSQKSDRFYAYAIAVHEAGHALGLSNFSYLDLVIPWSEPQAYHSAHPTIPDSVMNYDDRWDRVAMRWISHIRHPSAGTGFMEPDCSPHPFDIMAIYALYQTVPTVP